VSDGRSDHFARVENTAIDAADWSDLTPAALDGGARPCHNDSPAWARVGGWRMLVFSRSLGLAMGVIFLLCWGVQSIACRVPELGHCLSSAVSGWRFVLVDQPAEDRSTPDPAVDRAPGRAVPDHRRSPWSAPCAEFWNPHRATP
jgi:hypothetical protein